MPSELARWLRIQRYWLLVTLLSVAALMGFRLAGLYLFWPTQGAGVDLEGLMVDLIAGLRLDIKTMCFLWLLALLGSFPLWAAGQLRRYEPLQMAFSVLVACLCLLMAIINLFYYEAFKNHIDLSIMRMRDATTAILLLKTLFFEPRYALGLLLYFLLCLMLGWGLKRLWQHQVKRSSALEEARWLRFRAARILLAVVFFLLLAAVFRGSLTSHPLTLQRVNLSPNLFYNAMVPNGLWAFYEAANAYKIHLLRDFSEAEVRAALKLLHGREVDDTRSPTLSDYLSESTLEREPSQLPHVIVNVMENFGAKLIDFHTPDNNLLGRLERHLYEDYWFENFLSASQETVISMTNLITPHPFPRRITEGMLGKLSFRHTNIQVFKERGYRTVFVYSGRRQESNMGAFYTLQGIDEVYDQYDIVRSVPGARHARVWGVFDHYALQFLHQLVEEARQPLLVFFLSVSTHSPFQTPEEYQPLPLNLATLKRHAALDDEALIKRIATTYQYSADALGRFIDAIKSDPQLKENTIVAATGDHPIRYLVRYSIDAAHPSDYYRVPFYLYLPARHRRNMSEDTSRFGTHRDLLPTIINRIFKGARYLSSGRDLLARDEHASAGVAVRLKAYVNRHGAVDMRGRQRRYFLWERTALNKAPVGLQPFKQLNTPNEVLRDLERAGQAYETLLHWYISLHLPAST